MADRDKPALKDEVAAKVLFHITDPDGHWSVDLTGDKPIVAQERSGDATT